MHAFQQQVQQEVAGLLVDAVVREGGGEGSGVRVVVIVPYERLVAGCELPEPEPDTHIKTHIPTFSTKYCRRQRWRFYPHPNCHRNPHRNPQRNRNPHRNRNPNLIHTP